MLSVPAVLMAGQPASCVAHRSKVKGWGWKKIFSFHVNGNKKATVAIFISDETNFKTKAIKDKDEHYLMIKGSIEKEDIILIKITQ